MAEIPENRETRKLETVCLRNQFSILSAIFIIFFFYVKRCVKIEPSLISSNFPSIPIIYVGVLVTLSKLNWLRHEDFAVLGQFCAKTITYCLQTYTKCPSETLSKISNGCYQGELAIIILLLIYEDMASKLAKIGLKFQSISILAIRSTRRQETVSVP